MLFFGRLSQRRVDILAKLMESRVTTGIFGNLYGNARDEMISRTKVVVDIPFYSPFIIENPRLVLCTSNQKVCVAELPSYPMAHRWTNAVTFVPYEEIVSTCEALASDREAFLAQERTAYEAMRSLTMAPSVQAALDGAAPLLPNDPVGANR